MYRQSVEEKVVSKQLYTDIADIVNVDHELIDGRDVHTSTSHNHDRFGHLES